MLAANTLLQGRYQISHPIGQGGMGAVYMARDLRLRCTVAIKETFFSDDRLRRAFEREAHLLAGLRHPALPRVSDHFKEGAGQFLVMEFIPGDDLEKMVRERGGAFPAQTVLEWADQLLDALEYLHTQEPPIIHRDIKPQNLKLSRGQVILLDFGLAKGTTSQMSRVPTGGSIFGFTPNYAPLEQIQNAGADARSDLYSLAATLHHLLTGRKPPDALARASSILGNRSDPLGPVDGVHPAVADILRGAMALSPEHRPPSAAAMRAALMRACARSVSYVPEQQKGERAAGPAYTGEETYFSAPESELTESDSKPDSRDLPGPGGKALKRCPTCKAAYTGEGFFCVVDGARLVFERHGAGSQASEPPGVGDAGRTALNAVGGGETHTVESNRVDLAEARRRAEEEEEKRRREEKEEQEREREEARRREEEAAALEVRRKAELEAERLRAEEARRRREEEERRRLEEAEKARQAEEEERLRREEEERLRREEEERLRHEEEERLRREEKERLRREEEERRRKEEEEQRQREIEAARAAEEERRRKEAAEEERKRKAAEEEERRAAEARRLEEEERARREAEERARQLEAARLAAEEQRRRDEAERLRAEEEERRKHEEEEQRRRQVEE
ncbi:MAG TPA: serine/threonine-protein kinase, partial [Pyrinomonadaceae bacterium]